MKITLTSVMVDDQARALAFYTDVLGFVKKTEFPVGEFRWLTVVSPDGPDDIELALEPNDFPASRTYQKALFEAGIPFTAFTVDNIQEEYERLKGLGWCFVGSQRKRGRSPSPSSKIRAGTLYKSSRSSADR